MKQPKHKIERTLAELLQEDPGLRYRLQSQGKWHDVNPRWAEGSVDLPSDGIIRGVHPWAASPFIREVMGNGRKPKKRESE